MARSSLCTSKIHTLRDEHNIFTQPLVVYNDSMLCVRAAAPGSLRQCAPSRTALVLLCARASASATGAGTDHAQDSQATVAADLQETVADVTALSLVCQDETSQHLATSLPSSVFVGGATGGGVLGSSGGLHSLHGLVSAPSLVHGGNGVDSAHARIHRPVLPDVGSSMSSVPVSVRWPALNLTAAAPVGFRTVNYLPAASPASTSATTSVSSADSSRAASPAVSLAASPAVSLAASPAQGAIAAAIAGSNLLLLAQDCAYLAQVNAQSLRTCPTTGAMCSTSQASYRWQSKRSRWESHWRSSTSTRRRPEGCWASLTR